MARAALLSAGHLTAVTRVRIDRPRPAGASLTWRPAPDTWLGATCRCGWRGSLLSHDQAAVARECDDHEAAMLAELLRAL